MKILKQENRLTLTRRLRQPKGEYIFSEKYDWTLKTGEDTQCLETITSNNVIVMLERNGSFDITYTYSSPATGTRVASVNIELMKNSSYLTFFLYWSPENIALRVQDDKQTSVESKTCTQADYTLMAGPGGYFAKFGGPGVEIMSPSLVVISKNRTTIVESSAIKYWQDTLTAVSVLQTGESKQGGYMFENIISCLSLTMLCTGFEVYCKRRFLEISSEFQEPNYEELGKKFFSDNERKNGLLDKYAQNAKTEGHSMAFELVKRKRIDFGNYQSCSDAYRKGFGINLTKDLGISIQTIQQVIDFITYRHKLIHVSLLQNTFNYYEPEKKPVRADKATIKIAIETFSSLIQALHKKTIELYKTEEQK